MSKIRFLAIAFMSMALTLHGQLLSMERPNLILTKSGVDLMKASLGEVPLFDAQLLQAITEVDEEMATGIHVLRPKVMADGFRVESATEYQCDLPLWFQGHLLETNFEHEAANNSLSL